MTQKELLRELRIHLAKTIISTVQMMFGGILIGLVLADLIPFTTPVCGYHIFLLVAGLYTLHVNSICHQDWITFKLSLPPDVREQLRIHQNHDRW